jgi:hypothetical protein
MGSGGLGKIMDSSEDDVGLGIFTRAFPPAFNDACVITVALEVSVRAVECDEGPNEELKGNCFGPSNISAL